MSKIIGLTGGIASGKSTVSKMFKEREIPVIDTDQIAKTLLNEDKDIYKEILKTFGEDVLTPNQEINRNKLAQIIFKDKEKRKKLNAIIHPKVKEITLHETTHLKDLKQPLIVLDVPLLFEADFDSVCDVTIVVYARKKDQISRLLSREGIGEAYAKQKINAQMPLSKKKELADYIIDNSKSILETRKSFERVLKEIEKTNK